MHVIIDKLLIRVILPKATSGWLVRERCRVVIARYDKVEWNASGLLRTSLFDVEEPDRVLVVRVLGLADL